MYRRMVNPEAITERARSEDTEKFTWGSLDLMGGSIDIRFCPITGTNEVGLGRNGTTVESVQKALEDFSESEMRRTVRTILRYFGCNQPLTYFLCEIDTN